MVPDPGSIRSVAPPILAANAKWLQHGETIPIDTLAVIGPMYVKEAPNMPAPSFVLDLTLPIAHGEPQPLTDSAAMTDYRRYSPEQRAAFLQWRVDGDSSRLPPGLAPAFCKITFANVEWRVVIDGDAGSDVSLALLNFAKKNPEAVSEAKLGQQITRLLHLIGERLGLGGHLSLILSMAQIPGLVWDWEEAGIMLTKLVALKLPLPAQLAVLVAPVILGPYLNRDIREDPQSYRTEFVRTFRESYPRGFGVHKPRSRIKFNYLPIHPDTTQVARMRRLHWEFDVVDFFIHPDQFQELVWLSRNVLAKDLPKGLQLPPLPPGDFYVPKSLRERRSLMPPPLPIE